MDSQVHESSATLILKSEALTWDTNKRVCCFHHNRTNCSDNHFIWHWPPGVIPQGSCGCRMSFSPSLVTSGTCTNSAFRCPRCSLCLLKLLSVVFSLSFLDLVCIMLFSLWGASFYPPSDPVCPTLCVPSGCSVSASDSPINNPCVLPLIHCFTSLTVTCVLILVHILTCHL